MNMFPDFDEAHVISDLHMGGKPGFQMLRETKRLAGYIHWVSAQCPHGKVALILNGDVFDTLAEDIPGYIAVDNAIQVIRRIMEDPSFCNIWDALAEFVKKEGRFLIFIIGHSDIEIAFPTVQRFIISRLAGDDLICMARIEFSTIGAGFTCTVGNAKLFCTHGNEIDTWNYNRYEDLAKIARRLNVSSSFNYDEWLPSAGRRANKDILNKIKLKYKWIEFLKPETTAAIGTLLVLDPSEILNIKKLISIVGQKIRDQKTMDDRSQSPSLHLDHINKNSSNEIEQLFGDYLTVDNMLITAQKNIGHTNDFFENPNGSQYRTGSLIWDRITGWVTGVGQEEALRRALQDWLKSDRSFDIKNRDDTFNEITKTVGSAVDFIITGHTHLERAIAMGGNRFYFNSGTWVRLARFTESMLKDKASFKPVYELLVNNQGGLELFDRAKFRDNNGVTTPFVLDQTSAVSITKENGKAIGRLVHVDGVSDINPLEIIRFCKV